MSRLLRIFALIAGAGVAVASSISTSFAQNDRLELDANNCEVFVDKVALQPDSTDASHRTRFRFFVKVLPERLDSPVVRVAYYGHVDQYTTPSSWTSYWDEITLNPFAGSKDYFELELVHDTRPLGPRGFLRDGVAYRGSFFVETSKGTRYWAHSDSADRNYTIDAAAVQRIVDAVGNVPLDTENRLNIEALAKTADILPELNPALCR